MTRIPALLLALCFVVTLMVSADAAEPAFKTTRLTDKFYSEGAHFGDFNRDGKGDIVSGPFLYFGPDFKHKDWIYEPKEYEPTKYSHNFLTFTYDMNSDGWLDVIQVGWPGKETVWYENPGDRLSKTAAVKGWNKHVMLAVTDSESPCFSDVTGDGKPELICMSGGFLGYAEADWKQPTKVWTFRRASNKGPYQRYTHGIGFGDVNNDGRVDLLEARGWWEQPKDWDGKTPWKHHQVGFSRKLRGGAQMYAYDIDGDGDSDVITSLDGHGYGLSWFEQVKGEDGKATFREHVITGSKPENNGWGVKFSQIHAIDLVDMDGDGLKDIITGKRFWAHGPKGDAEPNAPAVLYWFKLRRNGSRKKGGPVSVDFVPHLIHNDSGVGTQVIAGDINGDGKPDVVVGNKKGTFVHLRVDGKAAGE